MDPVQNITIIITFIIIIIIITKIIISIVVVVINKLVCIIKFIMMTVYINIARGTTDPGYRV